MVGFHSHEESLLLFPEVLGIWQREREREREREKWNVSLCLMLLIAEPGGVATWSRRPGAS